MEGTQSDTLCRVCVRTLPLRWVDECAGYLCLGLLAKQDSELPVRRVFNQLACKLPLARVVFDVTPRPCSTGALFNRLSGFLKSVPLARVLEPWVPLCKGRYPWPGFARLGYP